MNFEGSGEGGAILLHLSGPLQCQKEREEGCVCVGSRSDHSQSSRTLAPCVYTLELGGTGFRS